MFSFVLLSLAIVVVTRGQEPEPPYFYPEMMNTQNGQGCYTLGPCRSTPDIARPIDCQDVMKLGATVTGVYTIYPSGTEGFPVRCDLKTDEGGWTVIQRRVGDSDFYKGWLKYQSGFGDLESNFWLGNEQIRALVSQGWYELRIDMVGPEDKKQYARYDKFSIGNADEKYKLTLGKYGGDAGDNMAGLNGVKFTTMDQDNDSYNKNCAVEFTGAWWYTSCHSSNLNGDYGNTAYAKGITWNSLTTGYKSLKQVDMKIRRWSKRQ